MGSIGAICPAAAGRRGKTAGIINGTLAAQGIVSAVIIVLQQPAVKTASPAAQLGSYSGEKSCSSIVLSKCVMPFFKHALQASGSL